MHKALRKFLGVFLVGLLGGILGSYLFAIGYGLQAVGKGAIGYRETLQPLAYSGLSSTVEADTAEAESITLTTYYPSPYGMYDGLGTYRLSVGDTNGDNNINNADLPATPGYLLVANRLGIGTTAPASSLHVVGIGNTDPSLSYRSGNAWSLETGGAELVGGILTAPPWTYWLQTRAWGSTALPLSLNPLGGNVGIGTTAPAQMLHVHSSGTWAGTRATTAATGSTSNDGVNFGYDDAYGAYVWNREASPVILSTSNAERLRVDASGDVGIGTASPGTKLHINEGDITISKSATGQPMLQFYRSSATLNNKYWRMIASSDTGLYIQTVNDAYTVATTAMGIMRSGNSVTGINFPNGNVGIGTGTPTIKLDVGYGSGTQLQVSGGGGGDTNQGGQIKMVNTSIGVPNPNKYLRVTNNGSFDIVNSAYSLNLFTVQDNGNVGIGTAAPVAKLDVNGSLNVSGNLDVSGLFNYQQRNCVQIDYNAQGRVMCSVGYYVAGIWDNGGGLDGPNGLVCCQ